MTRTQIQLPDGVYRRARKVCAAREISFAEFSRRDLEYILSVYAPKAAARGDWRPPKPRRLGWKELSHGEIKAQAQMTSSEAHRSRRSKK
jgi:hypothetical protein